MDGKGNSQAGNKGSDEGCKSQHGNKGSDKGCKSQDGNQGSDKGGKGKGKYGRLVIDLRSRSRSVFPNRVPALRRNNDGAASSSTSTAGKASGKLFKRVITSTFPSRL